MEITSMIMEPTARPTEPGCLGGSKQKKHKILKLKLLSGVVRQEESKELQLLAWESKNQSSSELQRRWEKGKYDPSLLI